MKLILSVVTALTLLAAAPQDSRPQRPPPSVKEKFDEVYLLSGFEPPRPGVVLWGRALKPWLRETPGDPRALTAYGGFLECLISRLSDSGGYKAYLEEFPPIERGCVIASSVGGRHDYCFKPVKEAFEKALKVAPDMKEARLRLAGLQLRSGKAEAVAARRTLEALATDSSDRLIQYLAYLLLGTHELATSAPDLSAAAGWFKSATVVNPTWLSARLGFAAVEARHGRIGENFSMSSAPDDPWYSFPCRVLDSDIAAALAARAR